MVTRKTNTSCVFCEKPLYRRPRDIIKYKTICCSDCRHISNKLAAKKGAETKYKEYIKNWKNGEETGLTGKKFFETSNHIRRYLFEKYKNKCSECGWGEVNPVSGKIPLQIEHVDGNWENCKEENLKLLCPNCHSLTPTYMALNRGNGRKFRYKESKLARG